MLRKRLTTEMVPHRAGREGSPVRVEVLVAFTRALIRNHPSGDLMVLSLHTAQRETSASDEEIAAMTVAVLGEMGKSTWPVGFF